MINTPTQEDIDTHQKHLDSMLRAFFPRALEDNIHLTDPSSLHDFMTRSTIGHGVCGWSGLIISKSGSRYYCSSIKQAGNDYVIELEEHHKDFDSSVSRIVIAGDSIESFTLIQSIKNSDYILNEGHALKMYEGMGND